MVATIVTVTKKGQATIPKKLRKKHRIGRKVMAVDTKDGVLLKPVPDPATERGSLRELFAGKTSRDLVQEARLEEARKEKKLLKGGRGKQ